MLSTVFYGSRNRFDELLVHWLSRRTDLRGVVWTTSTAWRRSWSGRARFTRTRLRRRGPLRTADEALFHLWYHRFRRDADHAELVRAVLEPYEAAHGRPRWGGDQLATDDVNAPEVLAFVGERAPDLGLAMCVNDFFGTELRELPRLGTLLWHEGITPEFKGLYAPFWAMQAGAPVGWTMLRMSAELDGGAILAQGVAEGIDARRHGHLFAGHKAIWDSLPAVEQLLAQLEAGTARPLERPGARQASWTYPGLSDLLRGRRGLRPSGT